MRMKIVEGKWNEDENGRRKVSDDKDNKSRDRGVEMKMVKRRGG